MFLYIMPMWLPLLVIIPLLLLLHKIKQPKTLSNKLLPPSPPRLPFLGNLHQLGAMPHQSLRKLSIKYGPVMLLKLGRVPLVVVSSAEAAREILKVHDLEFCSRPSFTGTGKLSYNFLDIAFSQYTEYWRELRKICAIELFSAKRVQSFRFVREEEVAFLIDTISQSSSSESPVNMSDKMYDLAGCLVFRMAFGKRFDRSNFKDRALEELIHEAGLVTGGLTAAECFPFVGRIINMLTGFHGKLERVFQELDSFFQEIIDDHLKPERRKQGEEDIIDVMLKVERDGTNNQSACQITENHIKAVLMNIFLAGVDTQAIMLVWAMAELARNPRSMHKAQEEVRNCIGTKGRVTEADIDQFSYLKMVIKETLRLHSPGPLLLPRESRSHVKVNGYDICPKTVIQVNAWAIGRDPTYWEKPEEFMPERFIDNPIDFRGQHFEFLAFGAGRRICPGIHMGLATMELALANLLYFFDWKLPNGMKDIDMEETIGATLTVSKKTPLSLVPVKYLP